MSLPEKTRTEAPWMLNLDLTDVQNFESAQKNMRDDLWIRMNPREIVDKFIAPLAQDTAIGKLMEAREIVGEELERNRRLIEQLEKGNNIVIEPDNIFSANDEDHVNSIEKFTMRIVGEESNIKGMSMVKVKHILQGFFPHEGENAADPRA